MKLGQWIGLIAILVSLYILWQIREVLLLMFAAIVIATSLNRLARYFQTWKLKRGFAVVLSVIIFFSAIAGFFWIIVPPFADQFQELTSKVPQGLQRLNLWLTELETRIPPQLIPYIPDIEELLKQAEPFIQRILGSSFAFVSGSLEVVLKLLLVLVLTGMFLASPISYRKGFIRLFPSFYRRKVDHILDECEDSLQGWVYGAFIAMCIVGLMSAIGLYFLQVPAALALGILAGFLNLIPNLGPTMSVVPAMAIALLDTPFKSLGVLILYFVIQQVESNFLTPIVMAHQVSLLPAVTLISQLFFAYFFGFLGLLLALPLTVVAKIWLNQVILRDILDKWQDSSHTETELVLIKDKFGDENNQETVNIVVEEKIEDDKELKKDDEIKSGDELS